MERNKEPSLDPGGSTWQPDIPNLVGWTGRWLMTKQNVHTVRHGDGWANRRDGSDRVSSTHKTQEQAIERGREIALSEGIEHLIHGRDGKIRKRNSYGNDPYPPKG